MSRYTGPKGKIVRRFGVNLFGNPKFDRLLAKRPNPPGPHGQMKGRRKISEYGQQLLEKQKLKLAYGIREKQFTFYYEKALTKHGITGLNLMILLEMRLDNVVYRMGMAPTRDAARQLVLHGHLKVNGRRVNIPSYQMRAGDIVSFKESPKSQALAKRWIEEASHRDSPEWVTVQRDQQRGQVMREPISEEIPRVANEQLVVELFSK